MEVRRGAIPTYSNISLIYNPIAGKLSRRRNFPGAVLKILEAAGHTATPIATYGPGTASELAAKCLAEGADLILAAGGDGTINEVVNGMTGSRVPLGILPGGTANVLATEIGLGADMDLAALRLGDCVPRRIAAGLVRTDAGAHSRYFLLMAGVGLDAHIVYNLNLRLKKRFGKLAYWVSGFAQLGRRFEEFDVTAGEKTARVSFALASRVRNYGGDLEIARAACLLESDFQAVLFEGAQSSRYLRYLLGVVIRRLEHQPGISVQRTRRLDFSSPSDARVYVQVDGEFVGRLPASVEIVDDALTLLMPPGYGPR